MVQTIYYIGGSTCCGKSSMAEQLAGRYKMKLYKLDDFLDLYMERLAGKGSALCKAVRAMSMEEMWMRDPQEMVEEALEIYREIYSQAEKAIARLGSKAPILAEGAGFLPELMKEAGVDETHYICCTPTRIFQYQYYSQRSWIRYYLKDCSNPDQAFSNWMDRDALFAERVRADAEGMGYRTMLVDGAGGIEENAAIIADAFGLKSRQSRPRPQPDTEAEKV